MWSDTFMKQMVILKHREGMGPVQGPSRDGSRAQPRLCPRLTKHLSHPLLPLSFSLSGTLPE